MPELSTSHQGLSSSWRRPKPLMITVGAAVVLAAGLGGCPPDTQLSDFVNSVVDQRLAALGAAGFGQAGEIVVAVDAQPTVLQSGALDLTSKYDNCQQSEQEA